MQATGESLEARVRRHHDTDAPRDGFGGSLRIRDLREVRPGVVAVLDSTGEVDLFVDTSVLAVREKPAAPYDLFADRVREAWQVYADMDRRYHMACVVEDRWHPYFMRTRTTFEAAAAAADAFFQPKT